MTVINHNMHMHTKTCIIYFIEPFMNPERATDMRTLRRCWLTEMQFSKGEARIVFSHDFAAVTAAMNFLLGVSRFLKTFYNHTINNK